MEIIFELIFGAVIEGILGLVGELLVELGIYSFGKKASGTVNRLVTALIYAVFAFLIAIPSLWFIPKQSFTNPTVAVIYFILSPLLAGLALSVVNWIVRHGIDDVRLFEPAKFFYGVVFVLVFSSTRALLG